MHPYPRAPRLRQWIKEIICKVIGVAAAAAIAGQKHLSPSVPAIEEIMRKPFDRRPIKLPQRHAESFRIVAEHGRRLRERGGVHFKTSLSIHLRLYQRSSFFS